jgi:hypothetical protein
MSFTMFVLAFSIGFGSCFATTLIRNFLTNK